MNENLKDIILNGIKKIITMRNVIMKKNCLLCLVIITVIVGTTGKAQDQPFVFTAYGGLFFPSNLKFTQIAESKSDLIWGGGIALPVASSFYITGDWSTFNSKALVNQATDSTVTLNEQFIHVGVLSKQRLYISLFLRISGGFSYTFIREKYSSKLSEGRHADADRKIGYYGGIGIEQPLDAENHFSIFTDLIYDYRHSDKKELFGDFGGLRIIVGSHLFVF
jgi:drug/metabolite transporter superfamily protein YnfA